MGVVFFFVRRLGGWTGQVRYQKGEDTHVGRPGQW